MIKFYADIFTTEYREIKIGKPIFDRIDIARACGVPDNSALAIVMEGDTFNSLENPTKEYSGDIIVKLIPEKNTWKAVKNVINDSVNFTLKLALGYYIIHPGEFLKDSWGLMTVGWGIMQGIIMDAIPVPETPKALGDGKDPYGIVGASNSSIINNTYPVVFGRRRITPPYVINYYTELIGDNANGRGEQVLHCTFCAGYGPLKLENFALNDIIIAENSTDIREGHINTHTGYGDIYVSQNGETTNENIKELTPNIIIKHIDNPPFTATIPIHTNQVRIVFALNGIGYINDNNELDIRTIAANIILSQNGKQNILQQWNYTGGTRDGLRFPVNIDVPSDWQNAPITLQVIKTSADSSDTRTMIGLTLASYGFRRTDDFMESGTAAGKVIVDYIVRATDSVKQNVGKFNFIATSILPIKVLNQGTNLYEWSDSAPVPTENPAAHYRAILKGRYSKFAAKEQEIDYTALNRLYDFCEEKAYKSQLIVADTTTGAEVAKKILAAARSECIYQNQKYSVWIDEPSANPSLILTPKNTKNFSMTKSFVKRPNFINAKFYNEASNFVEDNIKVYPFGATPAADDTGQDMEFPAIAKYENIVKICRYMLANLWTRIETYTCEVGLEHFALKKGDRVKLIHDTLKIGIVSGFITKIDDSRLFINIDEYLPIPDIGQQYGILIQNGGGAIALAAVPASTDGIPSKELALSAALPTDVKVGDMVAFGILGQETEDCIVQSKGLLPDWRATLTLTTYSPQVFDAEAAIVDPYIPNLTGGDYSFALVDVDSAAGRENKGNTVRDDGAVWFDFSPVDIQGTILKNYGDIKADSDAEIIGDGIIPRWSDEKGCYFCELINNSSLRFYTDVNFYGSFTLSFYMRGIFSVQKQNIIFFNDTVNFLEIQLYIQGGDMILYWNGGQFIFPASIIPDPQGNHYSVRFNENIGLLSLFKDGILIYESYIEERIYDDQGETLQTRIDNECDDQGEVLQTRVDTECDDQGSAGIISRIGKGRGTYCYIGADEDGASNLTTLQIGELHLHSWILPDLSIAALANTHQCMIDVGAQFNYLGELNTPPIAGAVYDYFLYSGITNEDFLNGKFYRRTLQNTWQMYQPGNILS